MTDLFWLSHEQLERIKPYFPLSRGAQRADDLKVISGIVFVWTCPVFVERLGVGSV